MGALSRRIRFLDLQRWTSISYFAFGLVTHYILIQEYKHFECCVQIHAHAFKNMSLVPLFPGLWTEIDLKIFINCHLNFLIYFFYLFPMAFFGRHIFAKVKWLLQLVCLKVSLKEGWFVCLILSHCLMVSRWVGSHRFVEQQNTFCSFCRETRPRTMILVGHHIV